MTEKRPRHNKTAAAVTIASAFACACDVHAPRRLTIDEKEQVVEAIRFLEGAGTDFAEALIDHADPLFDHHRKQSSKADLKDSMQQTVEIIKNFYKEGKILSGGTARISGVAHEGFVRDRIRLNFHSGRQPFIPVTAMHEAGHHLSDTPYETKHALLGHGGHAKELDDALTAYALMDESGQEGYLEEDAQRFTTNVLKHKDFPYLMNILFFLPTLIRNQWWEEAENTVCDMISSTQSTDNPQAAYDSLLVDRDHAFQDPSQWAIEAIQDKTYGIGSVLFYIGYFYTPIGLDEQIVTDITATTLFDTVLQDRNDAIQMYVDAFPDKAIETEEERSERQASKPEFRHRLH